MLRRAPSLALFAVLGALAGCGGGDDKGSATTSTDAATTPAADIAQALREAQSPKRADFPATAGRALQQIADTVKAGPKAGLASSVLEPGTNRLAFGVIGADNAFVYGKTAVYVAPDPGEQASGPYPAPADPMEVKPPFRSQNAAQGASSDIKAIYSAQVPFQRAGKYAVLVVTKTAGGLVGAPTQVEVRASEIPAVGERPPRVHTDTVTSAGGDVESIDTRRPTSDLHAADFADVVGKKPVALLFSTPQLCMSRVCGPVTDIAVQLDSEYGDRMTFIHQEVFRDNEVAKGLRQQLTSFGLQTEPWLFTFGADGRVAARLEGAFGVNAFTRAVKAALR
jgi:hypothetical protein